MRVFWRNDTENGAERAIVLSPAQHAALSASVADGEHASLEEALSEALDTWTRLREARRLGFEHGEGAGGDPMAARLKARLIAVHAEAQAGQA